MDLFYPDDPRHDKVKSDGRWVDAIVTNYSRWIRRGYSFRRNCKTNEVERAVSRLEEVYLEVLVGDKAFDFETGEVRKNERAVFIRPK